eukprot:700148-Amphidinium_carterae.1
MNICVAVLFEWKFFALLAASICIESVAVLHSVRSKFCNASTFISPAPPCTFHLPSPRASKGTSLLLCLRAKSSHRNEHA